MPSPREQWQQMTSAQRGGFIGVASLDVALRVWSLVDLAKRPAEDVHGPKWLWGVGLAVVNSAGMLPATYLLWGRRAGG
jgi:hypothetical protein